MQAARDRDWADEPGHENDNRWANRPRLDLERATRRHDVRTVPGTVFTDLAHLTRTRARLAHFHGSVETRIGPVDDPAQVGPELKRAVDINTREKRPVLVDIITKRPRR